MRRKAAVHDHADKHPTENGELDSEEPTFDKPMTPPNAFEAQEEPIRRYAIRWDASSYEEDAKKITIDAGTTVLDLKRTLFELFEFRKPQHRLADTELWVAILHSDSDKIIRSFRYDGTDSVWLKKLEGLHSIQEIAGVEDQDCVFILRYVKDDGSSVQRPTVMGASNRPFLGFLGDKSWNLDKFVYNNPEPLLATAGSKWSFQRSPELLRTLQRSVIEHFRSYKTPDKTLIPLYSFSAGVGTGKSRNAQEFLSSAVEAAEQHHPDGPLVRRLRTARVFHVPLENGSSLRKNELGLDPYAIISARLIKQLGRNTLTAIYRHGELPEPLEILKAVARTDGKDFFEEWSAVIIVDGLHHLLKHDEGFLSYFLHCLGNIALSGAFILICVTATLSQPLMDFHQDSRQAITDLPVCSMDSPQITNPTTNKSVKIFDDENNLIIGLLVEDCGGHGRALEALYMSLMEGVEGQINSINYDIFPLSFDATPANIEKLIRATMERIKAYYGTSITRFTNEELICVLRAIVGRRAFSLTETIPGTTIVIDTMMKRGLFRFVRDPGNYRGHLEAPYIWISILLQVVPFRNTGSQLDNMLGLLSFFDYRNIISVDKFGGVSLQPLAFKTFEVFTGAIRVLKSFLYKNGEVTSVQDFHAGAYINGDKRFINKHINPTKASNREPTTRKGTISTNFSSERVWVTKPQAQAPSGAPTAGNIVTTCESRPSSDGPVGKWNDVGRCRLYQHKTAINQALFDKEKENLVESGRDLFLFFTSEVIPPGSIVLGHLEGYVDAARWEAWFGPFAGRAIRFYGTN